MGSDKPRADWLELIANKSFDGVVLRVQDSHDDWGTSARLQ